MTTKIVDFMARGSARTVASAIETFAAERRLVTALVVPWESSPTTVNMSVTATRGDGWAIEHTNLGTITLVDVDGQRTRVVIADQTRQPDVHEPDQPVPHKPASALTAFARQIEQRFAER
jgi:hypothetical protein